MRPLSLLLSASLLVLSASASANTMPYPDAETPASGSTVQVIAPAAAAFIPDGVAERIRGTYGLSNGWRLKVERVSRRYIETRIDNQRTMRLHAVSQDKFVSRNGNVTMQFNQGEGGDDMTMSYVPDARLAQVVVISSRMAQR
jgi:hypothetical protein